jgi:hypothetical protein
MNYDEIIEELEQGVDLSTLEEVPDSVLMQERIVAMRQLAGVYEAKAQRLYHEYDQAVQLLSA